MATLKKRFGHLVQAQRKQRGFTQAQLAQHADVSLDMIAKVEGGSVGPRFEMIEKIARGLGVDPAQLFTDQLPAQGLERKALTDLIAELSRLSDTELRWVSDLVRVALKPRR